MHHEYNTYNIHSSFRRFHVFDDILDFFTDDFIESMREDKVKKREAVKFIQRKADRMEAYERYEVYA